MHEAFTESLSAGKKRAPAPKWIVHTAADSSAGLTGGLVLVGKPLPRRETAYSSVWIVPGFGIANADDAARLSCTPAAQHCANLLQRHVAGGGSVAASCSAAFLLQATGLLKGRRVTTSWWLASALQQREPECSVDSRRMVCDDTPIITAGAAFAQSDLMLHLLRKRFGATLADSVARQLLIDGREAQAPFVVPALLANGDGLISHITQRLESALPQLSSVTELAGELAMSERTLARRVKAATRQSTLALFHSVRLNRARALIESSRLSIDQIAERVGYATQRHCDA